MFKPELENLPLSAYRFLDLMGILKDLYPTFDGYKEESDLGLGCGFPFQFIDFSEQDSILDLGCATGVDCFIMAAKIKAHSHITGIDLTQGLINTANTIAKKNKINTLHFLKADIECMPFGDNSKNIITSNGVFSLVPNLTIAFSMIYRVLQSGGQFCFSDINKKADFN
mgnify:CR=1 FL=1